jgi:hypothetical protein
MKKRTAVQAALAVIGIIALALLLTPPIRPPKVRASRISAVNNVRSVTLTMTNSNSLTGNLPVTGK